MILWINGAFGSGKTQTAYELHHRLPDSFVYDPENIGYFIRENVPDSARTEDFQDYPMWRTFNFEMLDYIAKNYSGTIIVPMTITSRKYYDEIIGRLSEKYDVTHVILYAEKETLLKRIASRLERRNSWAACQIDRCIRAFQEEITEHKIHTDTLTISQTAEKAAEAAGITLPEDTRNCLQKFFERNITKLKHIRQHSAGTEQQNRKEETV